MTSRHKITSFYVTSGYTCSEEQKRRCVLNRSNSAAIADSVCMLSLNLFLAFVKFFFVSRRLKHVLPEIGETCKKWTLHMPRMCNPVTYLSMKMCSKHRYNADWFLWKANHRLLIVPTSVFVWQTQSVRNDRRERLSSTKQKIIAYHFCRFVITPRRVCTLLLYPYHYLWAI